MEPISRHRVSAGTEITGTLKFKGELTYEGVFRGDLIEGSHLIVTEHTEIHAKSIIVDDLTCSGLVDGDTKVAQRCTLRATAHFQGALTTFRLAMDDGATFSGGLVISKPANISAAQHTA